MEDAVIYEGVKKDLLLDPDAIRKQAEDLCDYTKPFQGYVSTEVAPTSKSMPLPQVPVLPKNEKLKEESNGEKQSGEGENSS